MKGWSNWVIYVQGVCLFFFEGTELEAEEKRKYKANWEHAIGRKRLASEEEVKTGVIDPCHNHPNYHSKDRYFCKCPKCELIKRRKKIERIKERIK
jgi:hypothetical protein